MHVIAEFMLFSRVSNVQLGIICPIPPCTQPQVCSLTVGSYSLLFFTKKVPDPRKINDIVL